MQTIMDEAMEVVLDLKGTPSGEHGDGIVRSPYVAQVYGDEVYGIFEEIKDAFDPSRHHEPGQEDRERSRQAGGLATDLRYGPVLLDRTSSPRCSTSPTASTRSRSRSATAAPSARAWWRRPCAPRTKPPCGSTPRRAPRPTCCGTSSRASSTPRPPTWRTRAKEIDDYCIECGMCALECPSNVNIPKLMLEAKSKYRAGRPGHAGGHDPGAGRTGVPDGAAGLAAGQPADEPGPAASGRREGGRHRPAAHAPFVRLQELRADTGGPRQGRGDAAGDTGRWAGGADRRGVGDAAPTACPRSRAATARPRPA